MSAVDEDTARAVASGRETLGTLFSSAQSNLQRVFIVFVVAFMGTFWALRVWIWDFLEATAEAEMAEHVAASTDIITRTPFEVILLQAKIGLIVGIIFVIPAILYYARRPLKERGYTSAVPISRAYAVGFAVTSFVLFWLGIIYAYAVFFPFAFDFLATNAVNAGVKPSFGITEFTEFIALLTISFGLAAQLPLFMSVFAYTEIISYETFRDRWRHAIVGITVFGALFSPPDPFTLIMWAMPLVVLYVFSLGLAKLVTNIRRRGAAEHGGPGTALLKRRVLQFLAAVLTVFGVATVAIWAGGLAYLRDERLPELPSMLQPEGRTVIESLAAGYGPLGPAVAGLTIAGVIGGLALGIYTLRVLRQPVYPPVHAIRRGETDEVDLSILSVEDLEEVPPSVFEEMSESEMMDHARTALQADDREKAQAIIDRYESLEEGEYTEAAAAQTDEDDEEGDFLAGTAAGMMDPFTEDETTEEDIGGYAYDIAFIFNSLTSKMFRIVGVFMVVLGGTFFWLYSGGLGLILKQFLDRVPEDVLHEVAVQNDVDPEGMSLDELITEMDIVIALHPVEVLIFEVKVSTLAAIITVLPMICYYAWPAMKERGLARGDRRVFVVWGGALLAGFAVGTYLGFFYVAPAVISYLVSDAITNGMVVSYRIKSFFWLVIFTTVGIGFLLNIIVTMALFHVSGIVSLSSMVRAWRFVVVAVFVVAAIVSPRGILTMLALATPVAVTYVLGVLLLWLLTVGGRLFGGGGDGEATEPDEQPTA